MAINYGITHNCTILGFRIFLVICIDYVCSQHELYKLNIIGFVKSVFSIQKDTSIYMSHIYVSYIHIYKFNSVVEILEAVENKKIDFEIFIVERKYN